MFYEPAHHKELGEIITIRSPGAAEDAAEIVLGQIAEAKRRDAALARCRALTLAANRAAAMQKRKNLSEKEREELKEVERIYKRAAVHAWRIYHQKFGE